MFVQTPNHNTALVTPSLSGLEKWNLGSASKQSHAVLRYSTFPFPGFADGSSRYLACSGLLSVGSIAGQTQQEVQQAQSSKNL